MKKGDSKEKKPIHLLQSHYYDGLIEAGCDEAGRGCLAGSVYAAAVILPQNYSHPYLNDSKQLTEKRRMILRKDIEKDAIAWAVGVVSTEEIDEINILKASFFGHAQSHRSTQSAPRSPHYRWQPLHSLSEFALYAHCKRRL